ncbi:branched-chain amino acid aminotransferase [Micromonospora sp. WMMD1082]|uniref:branched-chain amino acid aminotransferase n=1 Tax=Micromonospora sp. WMMD1082 TaxID=3016104 RepID=UPI002417A720|nr:branched-chain amino acid aminotransferase [Micromonospora sp. WMMD1082]MDG4794953.1 branched-chain amino acid aminotransferase [Micromonospora sp. WMMD1082]
MSLRFALQLNPNPVNPTRRAEIMADPGFGRHFTDHMARAVWTPDGGWQDSEIIPFGPIPMHPAAAVLHYAQEIFEGMKAYRHADGSIWSFRPAANGERFARSAQRLALPELPVPDFMAAIEGLVAADQVWVPQEGENSLYLRPFMFASEPFLGVRPANEVTFMVIACPVGAYFSGGVKPVSIWLSSTYTRAARGGTGEAKCGGNYAASLAPMIEAAAHQCEQVCFLDAAEGRYVEELGGMNLFFVTADGRIVTPELGTILEGVTRGSILILAKELGLEVEERPVAISEWQEGAATGAITEVFACGTGAVVTPVGRLVWEGGEVTAPMTGADDSVAMRVRRQLMDIQYGRAADPYGWMTRLA